MKHTFYSKAFISFSTISSKMSPTLSSLLARSCLENNLRKSSVLLPLALYIKYTNGRPVRCECSRRGIGQKVWHERLHHHSAHSLLHRLYHAFDGKHVARGFAARVTRQQDVAMHSTQQCVKDGTVTEKHNQTPHVTGRNRLERANGIGATETRVHLHRPVVPIWLPSTEICPMSPILPTPPKHYHREKQTHHSSNDTRITQFISQNHSVGN